MAINRFSRGPMAADVQSEFIPLPIDVIDRQIQRRQSQYDLAKQTIDTAQESAYGVKGLSPDKQALTDITAAYDEDIKVAIDKAGGDYSRLTAYSDLLAKKVNKDIQTGQLGAIQNNFIKAQNHMNTVSEELKKGNISQQGYDRAMASISGFGGTIEDGKGGYTQASFYQPTKYLEMGKTADEYGKVIRDQYNARGEKYINSKTASGYIEQNLWNNPQAVANAREQVWATYGELSPSEESKAIDLYFKNIAGAAGKKIAFQQIHKPEGLDETTGGALYSYDIIGARPESSRTIVGGKEFGDILEEAKEKGEVGFFKTIGSTLLMLAGKFGPTSGPLARMEHDARMNEWKIEGSEKVKKAVKEISKSDLARDIAESQGVIIDWENPSIQEVNTLNSAVRSYNNSNANTRIFFTDNEKERKAFNEYLNTGGFLRKHIQDVESGHIYTPEEKAELYNAQKADPNTLAYGGQVSDAGVQPYGPGTKIITVVDAEGTPRSLAILSDKVNTQDYRNNRAAWAATNGISNYNDGVSDITFLRKGRTANGVGVQMYINGKKQGGIIEITK